jgi:hypothetical protein
MAQKKSHVVVKYIIDNDTDAASTIACFGGVLTVDLQPGSSLEIQE